MGTNVVLCASTGKMDYEGVHFKEGPAIRRTGVLVSSF